MRGFLCVFTLACGASGASVQSDPVPEPVVTQPAEEPAPEPEPIEVASEYTLMRGQDTVVIEGELTEDDMRHPRDQSFYDRYTIYAEAGDRIVVEHASQAFDAYLQLRIDGVDDAQFLVENDDAVAGDTDARVETEAPQSGVYVVWANSLMAGETGAYRIELTVEPSPH